MKPIYKLHHIVLNPNELPETCKRHWKKYWEEYGSPEFVTEHYGDVSLENAKFEKIVAFSDSEIRAWFYDLDDIRRGKEASNTFRFENPRYSEPGDKEFFDMWESIKKQID